MPQVKCVLCKAPMASDQALVEHLNQVHGLPGGLGGRAAPSQSFHAPHPHHPQVGHSHLQQHQHHPQVDQVASLLSQLLPALSQPHSLPHPHLPKVHPYLAQPTALPPQLGLQQPQLPHAQLPSAYPTGFHAASLFPSNQSRCGSDSKLKSGLDRSVAPNAAVFVLWPHEAFDRVSGQKDFKHYGDLSTGALAAGMVRSIMYLPEFSSVPTNVQMQLQHMSTLFHSIVATNNLKSALEFQKSILLMLERGQLRWEPQFSPLLQSMQINYLATVRQTPSATGHPPDMKTKTGRSKDPDMDKRWKEADLFCVPYQSGSCPQSADHDKKRHLCRFCYAMRNQKLAHVASSCPNDPRSS